MDNDIIRLNSDEIRAGYNDFEKIANNPYDKYAYVNGYGKLVSISELKLPFDEMIEFIYSYNRN